MIIIAKILSIVLGLTVIAKTYLDYKKKHTGLVMFLFWTIAWLIIIGVSLYPIIIDRINAAVGDNTSGITAFLSIAFIFIFFVTYRVYVKANRLEQKIQEMVVKLALKDLEEK